MAGLNHDFLLVFRDEHDYDDYWELTNSPQAVLLHNDLVFYINDSLKWIQCYIPRGKNDLLACEGLDFYGTTIIKDDGAEAAKKIFTSWADLFSNAPQNLELTGNYQWLVNNGGANTGNYSVIKAERDKLVESLRQIAGYAEEVENSNGKLFILHLGI